MSVNDFTDNDLLDEYFKSQQIKIFDNKNSRQQKQEEYGYSHNNTNDYNQNNNNRNTLVPGISMKSLFQKDNQNLKLNGIRQQKDQKFKQQQKDKQYIKNNNEIDQIEQQNRKTSQLDLQIQKMNEIICKESKDEMLLFTVNNSLQDKYISKHLKADLGSLGEFMKINEVQEIREEVPIENNNDNTSNTNNNNHTAANANTIANNARKQQQNMEEIEQEEQRVAMIQANPLNVLGTDKDLRNKTEAAEYLIHQLLTKTFGQSDIKALKTATLDQLNFDRSNQTRLKQIQSDKLLHSLYNLNKRNNNINDFMDNKIDLLLDEQLPFRKQILELSNQAHYNMQDKKKQQQIQIDRIKKNSILQNANSIMNPNSNLLQYQTSHRETSELHSFDDVMQESGIIEELIGKDRQLQQAYSKYKQNQQEIDEQTVQMINQLNQKPKKVQIQNTRQNSLLEANDKGETEETQVIQEESKQVLIRGKEKLIIKNMTLSSHTVFSIICKQVEFWHLEEMEITNVTMELSGVARKGSINNVTSSAVQIVSHSLLNLLLQLTLHFSKNKLQQLSLNKVCLNEKSHGIIQGLLMRSSVQALTLTHVELKDRELIELARVLIEIDSIQHLDLSFNLLDDQTHQTFSLMIKYLSGLKLLNLHANKMTRKKNMFTVYRKELQIII